MTLGKIEAFECHERDVNQHKTLDDLATRSVKGF